jgi:catechol 2,3-dioxygenase-like lactoylglutathione lyase family enzyme
VARVFDHVTIRVSDRAPSERFYDTVLATIGLEKAHSDEQLAEWGEFSLSPATDEKPVTRRLHIGFAASSRALVDEFWRVGTGAGYRDDGAPGLRPQYGPDYYGAFLLDPDGNSAEAVHHDEVGGRGIDHLWIRVADVAAAKRFYQTVAAQTRFRLADDRPDRAWFRGGDSTFSVVAGTPSEHVHLAFGTTDDAVVHEFHRAATAAGYRDNGGPGERSVYHPGYYSAFVLDPDGNNVEVVNHNRS